MDHFRPALYINGFIQLYRLLLTGTSPEKWAVLAIIAGNYAQMRSDLFIWKR